MMPVVIVVWCVCGWGCCLVLVWSLLCVVVVSCVVVVLCCVLCVGCCVLCCVVWACDVVFACCGDDCAVLSPPTALSCSRCDSHHDLSPPTASSPSSSLVSSHFVPFVSALGPKAWEQSKQEQERFTTRKWNNRTKIRQGS